MTFHNVRLPEFIEIFACGSPQFSTSLASTVSGREIRRADSERARQKYFIENCKLSCVQFEEFNAFFRARGGQNCSFRFKDFADFKAQNQIIPDFMVEGLKFGLVKIYDDKVSPYIRKISKPVKNSVKLSINRRATGDAYVNYETGIVTLQRPLEVDSLIKVDFQFDVEVRFAQDSFKYQHNNDGSIALELIELIEVI